MPRLLDTRLVGRDFADVLAKNYSGSQPGWTLQVNKNLNALQLGPVVVAKIWQGPYSSDPQLFLGNQYINLTLPSGEVVSLGIVTTTGSTGAIPPATICGQIAFTIPGVQTWIVPDGVTSICAVAVGAGGGGATGRYGTSGGNGGDLRWINNFTVVPGQTVTVTVGAGGAGGIYDPDAIPGSGKPGGLSKLTFDGTDFLIAAGGSGGVDNSNSPAPNSGSSTIGGNIGGGDGGLGGPEMGGPYHGSGGGGGAGGYAGAGGNGGIGNNSAPNLDFITGSAGFPGQAGGGGGGAAGFSQSGFTCSSAAGGGVGLKGQGVNGLGGTLGGTLSAPQIQCGGGNGGSGGTRGLPGSDVSQSPTPAGAGGLFGGGGGSIGNRPRRHQIGSLKGGNGGNGGVRIIWGTGRSFPNTNTDDCPGSNPSYILPTDAPCYYNGIVVDTTVDQNLTMNEGGNSGM